MESLALPAAAANKLHNFWQVTQSLRCSVSSPELCFLEDSFQPQVPPILLVPRAASTLHRENGYLVHVLTQSPLL